MCYTSLEEDIDRQLFNGRSMTKMVLLHESNKTLARYGNDNCFVHYVHILEADKKTASFFVNNVIN